MISFYLDLAVSTPARYFLVPWSLLALLATLKSPKWFAWFFAISLATFLVSAIALVNYANAPAVDSDGTTFVGVATLVWTVGIYGFATFLACAMVAAVRSYWSGRRSSGLETY